MKHIPPDAHWDPQIYDSSGNPIGRYRQVNDPLIANDPASCRKAGELLLQDPNIDRKALEQWLWLNNAATHAEMSEDLRTLFIEQNKVFNSKLKKTLKRSRKKLKRLKVREQELAPNYDLYRLKTGGSIKDGQALFPKDEGRFSTNVIAGKHDIHRGRKNKHWFSEPIGWSVTIGSGLMLGASLGFITGKLDLENFNPIAAMIFIGGGVLAFTGVCKALGTLSLKVGQFTFSAYHNGKAARWVIPATMIASLVVSALLIAIIDMKVESLGIFKAISASVVSAGLKVSPEELRWVSLVLIIPTLVYAVYTGFSDGYEFAASDKVESLQDEAIVEVSQSEDGQAFAKAAGEIAPVRQAIKELEEKIKALEEALRDDLTPEQRRQIREVTDDDVDYTIQAMGAAGMPHYRRGGNVTEFKSSDKPPFWKRFGRG